MDLTDDALTRFADEIEIVDIPIVPIAEARPAVHVDRSGAKLIYFYVGRDDFTHTASWDRRSETAAAITRAGALDEADGATDADE